MIRVLAFFAIRSGRALCRDLHVNLAYRWLWAFPSKTRSRTIPRSRVRKSHEKVLGLCLAWCSPSHLRPQTTREQPVAIRVSLAALASAYWAGTSSIHRVLADNLMVAAKPRTRHEFAGSLDDNRQESNEAADHKPS